MTEPNVGGSSMMDLRAESLPAQDDAAYVEVIRRAGERGIPLAGVAWAGRGPVELDQVLAMVEEDRILRQRLAELRISPAKASST